MTKFEDLIDRVIQNGVCVTLEWTNGRRLYDLNTGMKSHLYIEEVDGKAICHMRYDNHKEIDLDQDLDEVWWDLLIMVKSCLCGRDFMGCGWHGVLSEKGLLKGI